MQRPAALRRLLLSILLLAGVLGPWLLTGCQANGAMQDWPPSVADEEDGATQPATPGEPE